LLISIIRLNRSPETKALPLKAERSVLIVHSP
jgi:hypothetical protein